MILDKEKIKSYYPTLWDEDKLIMAVEKGHITEEDFKDIVGVSIYSLDTMNNIQNRKQKKNNKALENFLANQTLIWTDSCQYGVTKEDQEEMAMIYTQYKAINKPLAWHPRHGVNKTFTENEFLELMIAINDFVQPYLTKCQQIKEQIYSAKTISDLKSIEISY